MLNLTGQFLSNTESCPPPLPHSLTSFLHDDRIIVWWIIQLVMFGGARESFWKLLNLVAYEFLRSFIWNCFSDLKHNFFKGANHRHDSSSVWYRRLLVHLNLPLDSICPSLHNLIIWSWSRLGSPLTRFHHVLSDDFTDLIRLLRSSMLCHESTDDFAWKSDVLFSDYWHDT